MAEYLIYDKVHWSADLPEAEISARRLTDAKFDRVYRSRMQAGDVVEVRPDGYWTGPNARRFNENAFRVVSIPGPVDKSHELRADDGRPAFNIPESDGKVTVRASTALANLTRRSQEVLG